MRIPKDFRTFIIHGLRKTNVYGVPKNECVGNSVLDGMEYIKKNYESSLVIPTENIVIFVTTMFV